MQIVRLLNQLKFLELLKMVKKGKNASNCTISNSWVLDHSILADEPFVNALQIFETNVLVNNNLCEILVSPLESPTTFDERFKVN